MIEDQTSATDTAQVVPEWASTNLSTTLTEARTGSSRDMFFIFGGINLAVTNLGGGALGIVLGLSLRDVLLVYLIAGAIGSTLIGACVVQAKRTGASVMVNARPAFGYLGARLLSILTFLMTAFWFGVNNYFGVTAARSIVSSIGGPKGRVVDIVLLVLIISLLVVIAVHGYKFIMRYEMLTVGVMGFAIFTLAIGAITHGIDWSYPATVTGGSKTAAIATLVTALGVGWAVSWTPYVYDFGRYLRNESSEPKAFGLAWAGMWVCSTVTFGLSAVIATSAESGFDVGKTVEAVLPGGLAVIILIVMTIGILPANLANLMVGPAILETVDLKLTRITAVVITALFGLPIAIIGIFQPSFASVFEGWMLSLGIWLGPWLTITLIDFFVVHRGEYRQEHLLVRDRSIGGDFFVPGVVSWVIGVAAALAFANSAIIESPLMSSYFAGADVSIFAGSIVAGLIYYPWATRAKSR